MEPLNIAITDLKLDTIIGERYDGDQDVRVPLTLADAIVEAAARRLADDSDWVSVKTQVRQIRAEEIRTRVKVEIEAALTGPISLTNHYGEVLPGRTTTLREEIVKMATEALKVNHNNTMSRELTPAQKVIRDEVDRAIAAELATVVKAEKDKVVAAVRAKAADLIAQAVREGVGR